MTDDNPPDLGVEVSEDIGVGESLGRYKPWFNGMHFFFTVKLLPPHN
jgi:hypothetical protein